MPNTTISPEIKSVIDKFAASNVYPKILDKDNLLGILVYGSSLTGYSAKNSDIDVLVVLREADTCFRGVTYIDGRKVEYFFKPIEKFLSEAVGFTKSNCPSHIAMYQNAYFYYDQGDIMKNFLQADNQFYNANREKPKTNEDIKFVQIENRLCSLTNILQRDGQEFYMVYYNVLEMIRAFHSLRSGESDVPFAKAYRVYNDKNYYNQFVGKDASNPLPDPNFVELYNKCINLDEKPVMMGNINNLYNYEKQFVKIDPNNFTIAYK